MLYTFGELEDAHDYKYGASINQTNAMVPARPPIGIHMTTAIDATSNSVSKRRTQQERIVAIAFSRLACIVSVIALETWCVVST